jgi:hypothetical protein
MRGGKMLNDSLATRFVVQMSRLVAGDFMLQRSDARGVHALSMAQGKERGTGKFTVRNSLQV